MSEGVRLAGVGEAYASRIYCDTVCGQVVQYSVGFAGLPVVNANNNYAGGFVVRAAGDVVLAVRDGRAAA